jgi:hypothetical protein
MSKKEFKCNLEKSLEIMNEHRNETTDYKLKTFIETKMSLYLDCAWDTGMISLENKREYAAAYSIL